MFDTWMEQYILDTINDEAAPKTTKQNTIKLEKQDNAWLIVPDDNFFRAIAGNLDVLDDL